MEPNAQRGPGVKTDVKIYRKWKRRAYLLLSAKMNTEPSGERTDSNGGLDSKNSRGVRLSFQPLVSIGDIEKDPAHGRSSRDYVQSTIMPIMSRRNCSRLLCELKTQVVLRKQKKVAAQMFLCRAGAKQPVGKYSARFCESDQNIVVFLGLAARKPWKRKSPCKQRG